MKRKNRDFYEGKPLEIPPTAAFDKIQLNNTLANFFTDHLPLSCHIVPYKEKSVWYTVAPPPPGLHPSHFELYYGRSEERLRHYENSLNRAAAGKKPVLIGRGGFLDAFFPVFQSGRCQAVITCGAFMREAPDVPGLLRQWKELTGREAVRDSTEFLSFARVALEVPVVPHKVQKPLFRFLEILSYLYFSRRDPVPLLKEIEELKASVFARELPHRMWNYVGVKKERLLWWYWHGNRLAPWDKRDFRLDRLPNTVLAVAANAGKGGPTDELSDMARAVRLQRLCYGLCRQFPNTVSGRMELSGAYLLTYADPSARGKQGKAWVRDLAARVSRLLQDQLRVPVAVGIGRIAAVNEEIPDSFREAELALHLGIHLGQSPYFFQDLNRPGGEARGSDLWELSRKMVEAYSLLETKEAPLLRDRLVEKVLRISGQRLDALRVHFQYIYYLFLDILKRRTLSSPERLAELSLNLEEGLRRAASVPLLLAHFQSTLETFTSFFRAPAQGENQFNLNRVRDFLAQNISQPPSLAQAAKEAGYSTSRFSKLFKKKAGLPYSDYLLGLRLENAQRLLKEGSLPVSQVAQECGFKNSSYFVQCFRRRFGATPKAFRHKAG